MAGGARQISPRDYILSACELHLQAEIDVAGEAAVDRFLAGGGPTPASAPETDAENNHGGPSTDGGAAYSPRLFVWIPSPKGEEGKDGQQGDQQCTAVASTDTLDAKNLGAIAFVNTSFGKAGGAGGSSSPPAEAAPIRHVRQIHCMTLSPRVSPAGGDGGGGGDEGEGSGKAGGEDEKKSEDDLSDRRLGSDTFQSLQLYARHCFVPAIRAVEALSMEEAAAAGGEFPKGIPGSAAAEVAAPAVDSAKSKLSENLEGLEDKIRQLDAALDQVQRLGHGGIPPVHLAAHPVLSQASRHIPPSGKIDLDELGLAERLADDAFLNDVQRTVNQWIVQIRKVTALPGSTPFPETGYGADLEEIAFWKSLDQALQSVRAELSKPEVLLTVAVLKAAKRFLATIALENNTGMDAAEAHASDVVGYLRNVPADRLASARDLARIGEAVDDVFDALPRVRHSRFYDLERCAGLVEAVARTFGRQVAEALRVKYKGNGLVLTLGFAQYETVHAQVEGLFVRFDAHFDKFREFFVDHGRKMKVTGGGGTPAAIMDGLVLSHIVLRERLNDIYHFRTQHERLRVVVTEVLGGRNGGGNAVDASEDPTAVREVEEAPLVVFATVDVLDLSPRSTAAFAAALEGYDRRIDGIEERLARLLRNKLTAAQDAEEMFRVFARFHPLLARTRVRAAVKEFQIQLISTVTQAIQTLQSKFSLHYEASPSAQVARVRGVPPVSGKILWARQMERQVQALMKRMGDVLGNDWGQQLEGRALRRTGDDLLAKLDARAFLRSWVAEWERDLATSTHQRLRSYPIRISRDDPEGRLVAVVNFDEKSELLFREVRQLLWLGFGPDIPRTLVSLSEEAMVRYPHATALRAALRSYTVTRALVGSELEPLLAPQLRAIREAVQEAFDVPSTQESRLGVSRSRRRMRWDMPEMGEWVVNLSELVSSFEERVDTLLGACDKIDAFLSDLRTVEYESRLFSAVVEGIQRTVDELSLAGFADLATWVRVVDAKMASVLSERLEQALGKWSITLQKTGASGLPKQKAGGVSDSSSDVIQIPSIGVEILLRNQEISASPSVPVVRSMFMDELHDFIGVVCCLPRPTSGRFEIFGGKGSAPSSSSTNPAPEASNCQVNDTFHFLVQKVDLGVLADAYASVESHMSAFAQFVNQWLGYQSLWDTRLQDVAGALGGDVDGWQQVIVSARNARTALDSSSTFARYGPIHVRYDKVQSQVNLKYDAWQRELQGGFAAILSTQITEAHDRILSSRSRLEAVSLEGTTGEIVSGVTYLQEMKQMLKPWGKEIEKLCECERLLKRQRHPFPSDWMEASRAKGQYAQFEQILAKRSKTMSEQIPVLQQRVLAEDKNNAQRVAELLKAWEDERPLRGNLQPNDALDILTKFEFTLKKSMLDFENLSAAKDALGLESSGENVVSDSLDELNDLKEVWSAVGGPFSKLEELKDTLWGSCVPRKVRSSLENLLAELRSLSNRIRQYDAYTFLHDTVKKYIAGHSVLNDLKTDALKERHWKTILSRLAIRVPFTELTVGLLWDGGVLTKKKDIAEILTVAQGEMALEVFLQQVRDRWVKQELELVLYQNRVRLIKGWDDLFATLDDHMGGLTLMRSSPYYRAVREFQEEGNLWDDRLTKLRAAFDAWVDVQRRWVYLEGIFFGSADIKAQLPAEWSRFKSVDGEFVTLMRRISQRPYAMEALNIDNLQRTLDRLGNLMSVIQRALGDYLQRQRADFSRFYFLGDDDLLEIVGNSGEPGKVLTHVGKMFAAISSATHDELPSDAKDNGLIARLNGMVSKDGELVPLCEKVDVTTSVSVKEWLKQLESGMQTTLAKLLQDAIQEYASTLDNATTEEGKDKFVKWAQKFPAQVMILATLVKWSMGVDEGLRLEGDSQGALANVLNGIEAKLEVMAESVLLDLPSEVRKKFEQLITELVHQRDVTRSLMDENVTSANDFRWLYHLRFAFNPMAKELIEKLCISLSNANFFYGFEYLGIGERLVQTPLTDRCYLTLTQALHFRLGGNPFGPAGTGKTESVKALGGQMGRFVVVMNCDEAFDFGAMGRIFCGLCQVGAWGCFDEFNRLEERILSAVSQQILTIQRGLLERQSSIELLGRNIKLHENVGIFVTMNPGYAGRSNLPDNLKNLFRAVAMVVPDRRLIAQVMLFSQGIVSAEQLAGKIVTLFQRCDDEMSKQSHYDFGLRALKTLLVSAGGLKRKALEGGVPLEGDALAAMEKDVLIQGSCNNVVPKLVSEDLVVFERILENVFPGSEVAAMEDPDLREKLEEICKEENLVGAESWLQKVLQLKQVLEMRHGVMMVGPSGSGKSSAVHALMKGMERLDGMKGEMYIIDPKAMDKEGLYGSLDGTTMEWTDGVFTSLLRAILANQRGEADRRHWIVFDGDVDPEWAENLNSVLDDNKLLTLPSGERLGIPENLRIILEVDSLAQATPATVSRCGMVWFSEETVSVEMCLEELLASLRRPLTIDSGGVDELPAAQTQFIEAIQPLVISDNPRSTSLVEDALEFALNEPHVMHATRERLLLTLRTLLVRGLEMAIEYDENHPDFPMTGDHMVNFAKRWLLHSLVWAFTGSAAWEVRTKFGDMLLQTSGMSLPGDVGSLTDYRVRVNDGELERWSDSVPRMEIESHKVTATDVVVTTTDTLRHSDVVGAWLSSRKPLILCGPPGSGKTMTLTSVLQSVQGIVLASLNFSSRTTPEIILKTFAQHCQYVRRGKSIVLEPQESLGSNKWLVVFCDEINLPEEDSYGTQRVIMFMRQLVERGGFWRNDNVWVKINRIQFVGACNPPTDAGRVDMSLRFLRHAPLLLVDFPARDSLLQIYRTFNGGMMKLFPNLRGESEPMTEAMVELYTENQARFKPESQPQYFYSPRELSRWVRGMYEAVVCMDQGLSREELVRIWAHEALRLFCDRLVEEEEREWCENKVDEIARKYFAGVDYDEALARPLFYTSWLSKDTRNVGRNELKDFLGARLRVFYEEELDVPLVVFDEVLEHILRIDRVLRQPMGHCLLVGDSGAGKTVLSKFVSWMNGLSIFQIKAHSRYGIEEFNEDLRTIMRRVGVDGEKVCFIFDEGNALGSGFLEAMNALLASGEVPGLFDGDDYTALMHAIRDSASRDGVIMDSEEELWRRFTGLVQRNLHVVFTMNPSGGEWKNRSTTSPALFNRCVVDWFGTWGMKAMGEVGKEFTNRLDMGDAESVGWSWGVGEGEDLMKLVSAAFEGVADGGLRQAVVAGLVHVHNITKDVSEEVALSASSSGRTYLSPRDYLALIQNFVTCVTNRRAEVEDEQLHINAGLAKLRQTQENVAEMESGLGVKGAELREKEALANKKLQQMVADQNIAEKRKEEAERMSIEVEKQQVAINARKEEAQRDLDEAEPALLTAQASVRGIKRRDLDEVRNLMRPPNAVKLTLECVAVMMGEKKSDWTDVRKMLSKSDFIPNILNFDVDSLTPRQIKLVQENYIGGSDLTVESVTRSSKACGPLFQWAASQIKYSTVYTKVQPLREEVEELEKEAKVAKEEKSKIETEVAQLEDSISQYKADYATLIRDVEALKAEMETVKTKVDRARSLIKSLSHESDRWAKSSEGFQSILRSMVGDGLLLAAFLTYAGFFDFKTRLALWNKWCSILDAIGIEYRADLSVVDVLSKASERMQWQAQGLPPDSLSLENGVILDDCVRFPLIIDPSGQAIEYVMNKYREQKIQKTSFMDKAFMKTLAGAVRFGTTLLVENVETIDPVLNPILNREIQRTGGRSLVRIGTEDVDYSPKFTVILTTKNPAAKLTPDLCSRVTLVNFTVTPDSLQSQSMSRILQCEKPEVEQQRTNLLQLQGEQNVKLRELEEQMLAKISAVEGSILDDDRVVEGMEVLMREGAQVEEQIAKSADIMAEVEQAVGKFKPLAKACRSIFVLLESMRDVHFLYEFSSKFFTSALESVLKGTGMSDEEAQNAGRLSLLTKNLFYEVSARVGRGLLAEDKMVFNILLATAYNGGNKVIADEGNSGLEEIAAAIEGALGQNVPWQGRGLNDLQAVTESEIDATVPLMLCSAPGHDVSGRVDAMAKQNSKELASVAMGSQEGFATADAMISSASKRGTWVMLKNCHLCTEWLEDSLVKKLQSLSPHEKFRIFITSEINPKLPTSILRMSDIIVAEAPSGIKATLSRFFSSIAAERFTSPVQGRLYLILGWVHAVIQERLRFVPAGWSQQYEFTEADATHGLDVIDKLVEKASGGKKQRVAPEDIPWEAIRATLCKGIFGGRVTEAGDQGILDNLVNASFTSDCFNVNFRLVEGGEQDEDNLPHLPDGTSRDECLVWIESLPSYTPPTWIGLDGSAEGLRAKMIAESVMKKVARVGSIEGQ